MQVWQTICEVFLATTQENISLLEIPRIYEISLTYRLWSEAMKDVCVVGVEVCRDGTAQLSGHWYRHLDYQYNLVFKETIHHLSQFANACHMLIKKKRPLGMKISKGRGWGEGGEGRL